MDSLRVPKRPVEADIVHADGDGSHVRFFLADRAAGHEGPETLDDLLSAGGFLPASGGGGTMSWLSVAGLAMVTVSRDAAMLDEAAFRTLPEEHELEVVLASGRSVRGLACYVRPPEAARLTDFLNDPSPFLRLFVAEKVAYLNKRHVLRIVAREE